MGCAVGTVKSQVSAGLAKLRTALGDDVELLSANEITDEGAMSR
jgi:hypothetical protein